MTSLRELETYGGAWRVSLPLTSGMDMAIVTPLNYLAGPVNIGNQATVARRDGITILGVAAYIIVGEGEGYGTVTLRSRDPMYISGQINDYDIWQLGAPASGYANQALDSVVWALSPANYRTSPQGSGAILELVCNDKLDSGFITVWGIHGSPDILGRRAFSGLPSDWNA